ncbi:MAG: glutaredoxin 3 [Steroidobacteraceae bacterium]
MYATGWCPYCARARQLLQSKGAHWTEIDIEAVDGARAEMQQRSGRRTVPQIFIGERHIGGCDDLHALDRAGELDPLLAGA